MEHLKYRITTGWTLQRALFLLIGFTVLMSGATDGMWTGVAFGAYFMLMGVLGLGCAGGNCAVPPAKSHLDSEAGADEILEIEELN